MSQKNDHDFRDQHKILVLEMLTNPGEDTVTKILLHSVIFKVIYSYMPIFTHLILLKLGAV